MGMYIVTVKMPEMYIMLLDRLVRRGVCISRSDCIRRAVWQFIEKELSVEVPSTERRSRAIKEVKVIG
jgi:Ribbon-helix-helix protein, copG family.